MKAHWTHPDCICGHAARAHLRHYGSPNTPKYLMCRGSCGCLKYQPNTGGLPPTNRKES